MKIITRKILQVAFLNLVFTNAYSAYYGRFISGGFFSKEVFRNVENDRYNDVAILSERLFVNYSQILESNNELTLDLRDKLNFFDKLNSETLRLDSSNKIQLHQLNLKNSNATSVNYRVGRFPVTEAGAIYLDGVELGSQSTFSNFITRYSLFFGLNPQVSDQSELNFTKDANAYGGYVVFESKGENWDNYLYSTFSLARQTYKSEVDRTYIYNNTMYQTGSGSSLSLLGYLDLEPEINIQNLWASYLYTFTNKFRWRNSISTIDTIQYSRVKDIRETLPNSKYHQMSTSLQSPGNAKDYYELKVSAGLREYDKKNKLELKYGYNISEFIYNDLTLGVRTGLRKDFVNNAVSLGASLLFTNLRREISLSQDLQYETINKVNNYVSITELSYTRFFDRSLFGIISGQNIWDKDVSILSVLFKISYRFGEGGQAPLRDGAAPMGQL